MPRRKREPHHVSRAAKIAKTEVGETEAEAAPIVAAPFVKADPRGGVPRADVVCIFWDSEGVSIPSCRLSGAHHRQDPWHVASCLRDAASAHGSHVVDLRVYYDASKPQHGPRLAVELSLAHALTHPRYMHVPCSHRRSSTGVYEGVFKVRTQPHAPLLLLQRI
jgi:hypothetical protein